MQVQKEAAVARGGDRGVVRGAADAAESEAAGLLAELAAWGEATAVLGAHLGLHLDHTPYRQRLAEGRSIGSGLVEGACKTAIGLRLKQTGAWRRIRRLGRMAALYCLVYSDPFDLDWQQKAG